MPSLGSIILYEKRKFEKIPITEHHFHNLKAEVNLLFRSAHDEINLFLNEENESFQNLGHLLPLKRKKRLEREKTKQACCW